MRTRTRAEQTARAAKRAPRIAARAAQDSLARDMLPAAVTLTGAVEVTAKDIESAWAQQADQVAADVVSRALAGAAAPLRRVSSARRAVGPVIEKAPTIASARYLTAVRELPCHFCAAPGPSDPHHFPPRGSRGRNDLLVLPVCRSCHDDAQQNKIDVIDQAAAVHATQLLLFRLRGALWWLGVMKEIQAGLE